MNLDVGTAEINGEVTYTLLARIYVKNVIENTEKIFETTLNKYGSTL